jgi:hypothetical protein
MACTSPKKEEAKPETVAEVPYENPTLTDQQTTEGWQYLFDGKTMTGWRSYKNKEQNCWDIENGALHCKPALAADKRNDILIEEPFADYELSFEWKISVGGNSGVMYHASEEFDMPYYSGPEYQVIDDAGYKGDLSDTQKVGAAYDMYMAENKTVNPVGEWNESTIKVSGAHVEHWLNGNKVCGYDFGSDDWNKRKAASKWKDEKGYGMTKKGFIDLQDHGHEVWYRKIMIRNNGNGG